MVSTLGLMILTRHLREVNLLFPFGIKTYCCTKMPMNSWANQMPSALIALINNLPSLGHEYYLPNINWLRRSMREVCRTDKISTIHVVTQSNQQFIYPINTSQAFTFNILLIKQQNSIYESEFLITLIKLKFVVQDRKGKEMINVLIN